MQLLLIHKLIRRHRIYVQSTVYHCMQHGWMEMCACAAGISLPISLNFGRGVLSPDSHRY